MQSSRDFSATDYTFPISMEIGARRELTDCGFDSTKIYFNRAALFRSRVTEFAPSLSSTFKSQEIY